jgi:glutamine amidotransferase
MPSDYPSVTIIDLDMGNLQSVRNALERVGARVSTAETLDQARDAHSIVLPGVGAFERAISRLHSKGLYDFLLDYAGRQQRPILGICLGMQLLAERSHEHGIHEGLGLIPGEVVRLSASPPEFRVPNIGWISISAKRESNLFVQSEPDASFYHVHSYHLACRQAQDIVATYDFGGDEIVTAVQRKNISGVQFHPEKSQDAGLNLLYRWLSHLESSPA